MYKSIYVPVDNSDHSNAALDIGVTLAKTFGGKVIGSHVYAAKMHDRRFKQMEAGLPEELAAQLARATVTGASELLNRSSETPAVLRQNVTSPGGTTQAALDVLMAGDGLGPLMARAIAAATERSRQLAG